MDQDRPPSASRSPDRAWRIETPLTQFLRTESGSAAVLLAATIAALVWANVGSASYRAAWHTELAIRLGGSGLSMDLRGWVNSGLMTLFFFVVGLEARRELDRGELRERRPGAGAAQVADGVESLSDAVRLATAQAMVAH